jgi:hypothetical protein
MRMEKGSVKIHEIETLIVTVITDNYYDALRPDTTISKQFRSAPNASMHAEHGLSFFIETVINGSSTYFAICAQPASRNTLLPGKPDLLNRCFCNNRNDLRSFLLGPFEYPKQYHRCRNELGNHDQGAKAQEYPDKQAAIIHFPAVSSRPDRGYITN